MTGFSCEFCPADDVDVRTNCDGRMICDDCYYSACPSECENTEDSNCPRCYAKTLVGCEHGELCLDCKMEIDAVLADEPCEICGGRMDWADVYEFVEAGGAPWDHAVPCCHSDCAASDMMERD